MCRLIERTLRTFKSLQTSYGHVTRIKRRHCKRNKANQRRNEKLTKGHNFSQIPSITVYDDNCEEEEEDAFIGDIAKQQLRKFASVSGADKTFGLRDGDGKSYIGNKETKIKESNIIVGDKEYIGTPGLWKLIVATTPDDKIFNNGKYDNYAEIMH